MNKIIIMLISLLLIPIVTANVMTCEYDDTPYISSEIKYFENQMKWLCNTTFSDYSCITYIEKDDELLQTNPNGKPVFGEGMVDKFESSGQMVYAYFLPEANIILANETYLFGIWCSNGTEFVDYEVNLTPVYKDSVDFLIIKWEWSMNNMGYIVVVLIFIALLVLIIYLLKK